ncbi:low temperature requirement protein A [Microbacterium sp. SSM24]|uniref:low temperature requirement protein A n=1 Tax=Microbacterium sp. SSM24 TaxID=2991714 RepID=UPI00222610DA|nr:low temperature requirement protein A [Microbacterium sp. SSM24]MCW3493951.1 low temperature requirement protein A [Microbacterium sp. SSM24]
MSETTATARSHRVARMTGRDPRERHRAATPLELLFDLTFVVAFSQISSEAAHFLEVGEVSTVLLGFLFAGFAVTWAWINYSWLASAYDNDDVFFRIATLIEMVGVLILALGVPPLFESIHEGEYVDNGVMVAGYVVMRIAAIALWLRAAAHDPAHRKTCLAYVVNISIAQLGWIALIFVNLPLPATLLCAVILASFELAGPPFAELKYGRTPWHPHHIAERYGLLVIITLGEVILGTILAISAVLTAQGWTFETAMVAFGGTSLAFGLWWVYFMMPSGTLLARHPERGFVWGYGHIILFGSLVGVGAGLHVAAQVITHEAHVDATFALLCVAVPVLVFQIMLFTLYTLLLREFDPFHIWLFVGAVVMLAFSVVAVSAGASIGTALLIVAASPVVIIVGYETVGWRHQAAALEKDAARA